MKAMLASWIRVTVVLTVMCAAATHVHAADGDPNEIVKQVVAAVGGEANLLKLFRVTERINVTSDPDKPGNVRSSVLEPPDHWWLGKKDRVKVDKEPATFLVWAWTLAPLLDPKSKVEAVPDITEQDKPVYGLRVSESITPPMELYFDKESHRLVRIDWRSDTHRFSDWKELDGVAYPAKCVGYKKATGKAWYFSQIVELERLTDLPEGLQR